MDGDLERRQRSGGGRRSRSAEGAEEPSSTVAWIRAIQRGEGESAWRHLHGRYGAELEDYARRKIGAPLRQRLAAADLVQEALLRAMRKLFRMRHLRRGSFRDLLRADIRRIAIEKAREKAGRAGRVRPMGDAGADGFRSPVRSPSSLLAIEEDLRRIRRGLARLSRPYREVLMLIDVEGRSTAEAALRLGLKEETVRKQVQRARVRLRQILLAGVEDG